MHGARVAPLAGLALFFCACAAVRANDDDTLAKYLNRLGLVDLQTFQMEQRIEGAMAGEERRRLAERLADLYSTQLIEHADDRAKYDAILGRIQRLVEKAPEAKTAALDVMLLQADYFRAEGLMTKWLADRTDAASKSAASEILERITPQLGQHQAALHQRVEQLTTQLDNAKSPDDVATGEREIRRVQVVAARAAFFAAWAHYYLALSRPAGVETQTLFTQSRDIFRRILEVDGKYGELDPASLGLESIWRARTLIGLGLAEAASGNSPASQECFNLLDKSPAPPEAKDLSPYWRVQALVQAGLGAEAVAFARPWIESFSGAANQTRVSFCASLVRAGFGGQIADANTGRELAMLGVQGLIKMRQQTAVRQLIEKYRIPVDGNSGFYLRWLRAQQLLDTAEQGKRNEDYTAAERAFSEALAAPDAHQDVAGASQCQYQHAWCLYKTDRLEAAAKSYAAAVEGLKVTDAKTAADSAWMAFVCYQTLAKADRKHVTAAVNSLRDLQRNFPEHPHAKRVDYYIGKLQQAALPLAETLANLERVPPTAPDYLASRFDICRLWHEEWNKGGDNRATAASRLRTAVDQYLAAPGSQTDGERLARAALLGADVALNGQEPDLEAAGKYLATARPFVEGTNDSLRPEFHFRSLQLATARREGTGQRVHADWLAAHAAGSPYELPALIVVAKGLDEQPMAAGESRAADGLRVYRRLVELLGSDPETLRTKKNAVVALSRLAFYASESGDQRVAAEALGKLLVLFPNDQNYLRRAGLATYAAGDYAASLESWRKLVTGLPRGEDRWYEAKYYQLATLLQLDRAKAREAWKQFRLLYPDLGPANWRGKFAELQQQLE